MMIIYFRRQSQIAQSWNTLQVKGSTGSSNLFGKDVPIIPPKTAKVRLFEYQKVGLTKTKLMDVGLFEVLDHVYDYNRGEIIVVVGDEPVCAPTGG